MLLSGVWGEDDRAERGARAFVRVYHRTALEVLYKESLEGAEADAYDAFVDAAAGGHYAQTRAWAEVAVAGRRLVPHFALARERGEVVGAALVLRPRVSGIPAPVAIVERGPVARTPGEVARLARALAHALRLRGVGRLSVMPYWAGEDAREVEKDLGTVRFRSVQELDGAHVVTLRLDIGGKTDAEILGGKERESLRRKLRQAEKAGVTTRRGDAKDLPVLRRLYAELMSAQGHTMKPDVWFDTLGRAIVAPGGALPEAGKARGAFFLSEHEGEAVSALFASRHGPLAVFVLGASTGANKTFSKMAPTMMAAIRWARDEGCATFDLGGVPMDGDTDSKRHAIEQFKLDFAKERIHLVREHARWF